MVHPPLLGAGNGPDSLQSHNTHVLALSDYEVDDTTTDEEDEGDEDNDDDEYYYYEEEDEEDDEEDDEEFEDVLPPLTPYLAPMFPEEEPEEWRTDLQNLVNETRDTMKSELSDFEEFTTPREQRTSTPVDLCALADDPRALNMIEMETQPVIGRQQRCEPDNPTSKKRRLDKISGCESKTLNEGHLRSKRRRR